MAVNPLSSRERQLGLGSDHTHEIQDVLGLPQALSEKQTLPSGIRRLVDEEAAIPEGWFSVGVLDVGGITLRIIGLGEPPSLQGGDLEFVNGDLVVTSPLLMGGIPSVIVELELTRDGVDARPEMVGNTIFDVDKEGGVFLARWVGTNGVLPDAVQTAELTVEAIVVPGPVMREFTLDDIPLDMRANGGLWDFANATVVDGKIASVPDAWGGISQRQTDPAEQPVATVVDGMLAGVWPQTINGVGLAPSSTFLPAWYIAVTQYMDGAVALFEGNPSFFADGSSNMGRIYGSTGTDQPGGTGRVIENTVRRNGAIVGAMQALPLPSRATFQAEIYQETLGWGIGRPNFGRADRGWKGNVWLAIALGTVPDTALRQQIEGYLHWEFGTQAYLPADHPYKNARPMVLSESQPEPEPEIIPGTWSVVAGDGSMAVRSSPFPEVPTATPEDGAIIVAQAGDYLFVPATNNFPDSLTGAILALGAAAGQAIGAINGTPYVVHSLDAGPSTTPAGTTPEYPTLIAGMVRPNDYPRVSSNYSTGQLLLPSWFNGAYPEVPAPENQLGTVGHPPFVYMQPDRSALLEASHIDRYWHSGKLQLMRPNSGIGRWSWVASSTKPDAVLAMFTYCGTTRTELDFEYVIKNGVKGFQLGVHMPKTGGGTVSFGSIVVPYTPEQWLTPALFEIEFDATSARFYINSVLVGEVTPASMPAGGVWTTTAKMESFSSVEKHGSWAGWTNYVSANMTVYGIKVPGA